MAVLSSESGTPEDAISVLKKRVMSLLWQYQHPPACATPLPPPVAYEFQHAMAHVTYALMHCDKEGKIRQYRSAFEHLRRGLLDAWKVCIFESNRFENILTCHDKTGFLLKARLREYWETSADSHPPECLRDHASLGWYGKLHPQTSSTTGQKSFTAQDAAPNNNKKFFQLYHEWAQYELLLTAFMGEKDLSTLEKMLTAALSGFSISKMEACLYELQGKLVYEIIKKVPKPDFSTWLGEGTMRRNRAENARSVKDDIYHPNLRKFLPDLLDYYGIKNSIHTFVLTV